MINLYIIFLFVTVTLFLVSCKKDIPAVDYRTKLEGNYNCSVTRSERTGASIVFDTTYVELVKVEVNYLNENKNSVIINDVRFTKLKQISNYYECDDNGSQYRRKNAKFINDSLYYYVVNGSNGGATSYNYKGKK